MVLVWRRIGRSYETGVAGRGGSVVGERGLATALGAQGLVVLALELGAELGVDAWVGEKRREVGLPLRRERVGLWRCCWVGAGGSAA